MTPHHVRAWLRMSLRSAFGGKNIRDARRGRVRNSSRNDVLACEALEGRVVLSNWGGASLLGNLSSLGVVTGPIVVNAQPLAVAVGPTTTTTSASAQLGAAWQALFGELQTLASKSGVTIADVESLTTDSQAIAQSGFSFNPQNLHNAISALATAVAGGTSTTPAQSDFSSLFTGSSVPMTLITSTFNELVTTIGDSNVTTTDLSTVASDEAAIQSSLPPVTTATTSSVAAALMVGGNMPIVITPSTGSGVTLNPVLPIVIEPPIGFGTPVLPGPYGGSGLLGSLSHVGVVTGPVAGIQAVSPSASATSSLVSQLQSDIQALQTELQTLAAKSGVTVADLESLTLDGQAITQAGFHFNSTTLGAVTSELATAVAGGTSLVQAQSDFNALFTGSTVSTTAITNTFNDLVKTIGNSNLTTTDLSTVASDEAAIMTDLKNLQSGNTGSGNGGSGNTGSGNTGSGNTGSGNTGSGSTGSGNAGGSGNTGSGSTGSGSTGSGSTGSGSTGSGSTGSGSTGSGSTGGSGNTGGSGPGTGTQPVPPIIPVLPVTQPGTTGHGKTVAKKHNKAPAAQHHTAHAVAKPSRHTNVKATIRRAKD